MKSIHIPEFASYEEEAEFWDSLDTADLMEQGGEWLHFETPEPRAVRIAILPEIAQALEQRARAKGIAVETLVNVWLSERLQVAVLSGQQPSLAEPSQPYSVADDSDTNAKP